MTIVRCGELALRASKTKQGINGTKTQGWRRGRRTQRKPTCQPALGLVPCPGSQTAGTSGQRPTGAPAQHAAGTILRTGRVNVCFRWIVGYQSQHHSQTLPLISWSPQGLGLSCRQGEPDNWSYLQTRHSDPVLPGYRQKTIWKLSPPGRRIPIRPRSAGDSHRRSSHSTCAPSIR